MKPKPVTGVARHPKELTFAWQRGDEAFVRLWCALILAVGVLVVLWVFIRVVVPVSVAPDSPRVKPVQFIIVNDKSDPSLLNLLSDKSLPSLGVEEAIADAPMLEGMLSVLGLQEEEERPLSLYLAPIAVLPLEWPKGEKEALTLPSLAEVEDAFWPRHEEKEKLGWKVLFLGEGKLGQVFNEKALSWTEAVPAIRHSVWSVVIDADGSLAFAAAVDSVDAEIDEMIRKKLQGLLRTDLSLEGPISGIVELTFERKAEL